MTRRCGSLRMIALSVRSKSRELLYFATAAKVAHLAHDCQTAAPFTTVGNWEHRTADTVCSPSRGVDPDRGRRTRGQIARRATAREDLDDDHTAAAVRTRMRERLIGIGIVGLVLRSGHFGRRRQSTGILNAEPVSTDKSADNCSPTKPA